jgi:hypothetical protein
MAKKDVRRFDSFDPGKWMTTPFKKTDDGFLTVRAITTSACVFTYRNADGSVTRELRPPEEVFAPDTLNSMKGKPVTNDHPDSLVTPETAKALQVGSMGSNPSSNVDGWTALDPQEQQNYRGSNATDGLHVAIDMTITDGPTIELVLAGKQALSMGYTCDYEPTPGVWCGVQYDGIQHNIRYNHCAIVDAARAGDAAKIRTDSADAIQVIQPGSVPETHEEGNNMAVRKFNIDGAECEGDDLLISSYQNVKKRADAAEQALNDAKAENAKAISKLEGERDALKDRADAAEKALKEAKDNALDEKRIDEAANAKIALLDAASRANVEVKDGMSALEIKKAVIMALSPEAKLDGKNDDYIGARFDVALETLDAKADGENRETGGGALPQAPAKDRQDSAAHYQRMVENMKARSRGQEVK